MVSLREFVRESLRIEGINREPTRKEMDLHFAFLNGTSSITVDDLEYFVKGICGAPLRDQVGMNVVVNDTRGQVVFRPPSGGPEIRSALERICVVMNELLECRALEFKADKTMLEDFRPPMANVMHGYDVEYIPVDRGHLAFDAHCEYESLHPFMDGNGRSGRALWLKIMGGVDNIHPRGFLETFYRQTLNAHDTRSSLTEMLTSHH